MRPRKKTPRKSAHRFGDWKLPRRARVTDWAINGIDRLPEDEDEFDDGVLIEPVCETKEPSEDK